MPAFTEPFIVDLAHVQQRIAGLHAAIQAHGYDGYLHTELTVTDDQAYLYVRVDDDKINDNPSTYGAIVPENKFSLNEPIALCDGSVDTSVDDVFDRAIEQLHAKPSRRHRELNILAAKMQAMITSANEFNPEIRKVFVDAIRNASHEIGRPLLTSA